MFKKNIFIRTVQQFLQFLIILAIARFSGSEGNGIFSVFITDVSFFILLLGFSAESSITYFSAKNQITPADVGSIFLPLIGVQTILFFVGYYIVAVFFHYNLYNIGLTDGKIWGLVYVLSIIIFNYCNALLTAQKFFFTLILSNVIFQSLFLLGLLLVSLEWFGSSAYFFTTQFLIPAYTCLYILQALAAVFFVVRRNKNKLMLKNPFSGINRNFLQYMLMVYVGNIFQFLAYRLDVWLIDYFKTKEAVGIYSVATKVAQLWWFFPQIAGLLLFPLTALKDTAIIEKQMMKKAFIFFIISLIAAAAAILLYPVFIHYTVGDVYLTSYRAFVYLMPGILLFSITIFLASILAGKGKVGINMQASAICFISILLLDIWLIPIKGIEGAAIASSIGYSLSSIYAIIKYRECIKN